jgi:hypothetical protein
MEPFILLPVSAVGTGDRPTWYNWYIYIYYIFSSSEFLFAVFIFHIVTSIKTLGNSYNGLAENCSLVATDIFFPSSPLLLYIFHGAASDSAFDKAFDRCKNDEWISDFDLLFLDPGGALGGARVLSLSACVCAQLKGQCNPLISRRSIIGLMQKRKEKSGTK